MTQSMNLIEKILMGREKSEAKGRLYAKKNGHYYAFQHEGDVNYHGYRADDVGEDIKYQLDKEFA